MLAGSAICTEQHWVCVNGNCSETRQANTVRVVVVVVVVVVWRRGEALRSHASV